MCVCIYFFLGVGVWLGIVNKKIMIWFYTVLHKIMQINYTPESNVVDFICSDINQTGTYHTFHLQETLFYIDNNFHHNEIFNKTNTMPKGVFGSQKTHCRGNYFQCQKFFMQIRCVRLFG